MRSVFGGTERVTISPLYSPEAVFVKLPILVMMLSFPWARAAPARPRCASVGSKGTAPQPEGPAAQGRKARSGFLGSRGTAGRRGEKVEGAQLRPAGPASAGVCLLAPVGGTGRGGVGERC